MYHTAYIRLYTDGGIERYRYTTRKHENNSTDFENSYVMLYKAEIEYQRLKPVNGSSSVSTYVYIKCMRCRLFFTNVRLSVTRLKSAAAIVVHAAFMGAGCSLSNYFYHLSQVGQ